MSHHLDSPLSRKDTRLNLIDQYVFRGETGTVLIMNANTSLAGDKRTPGFHPEARYEFKINFDGLLYEDLAYRVSFGEPDAAGKQTVAVHRLSGEDAHNDNELGVRLADGVTGTEMRSRDDDGVRIWAGAAADPFYIDLAHLATVRAAIDSGTAMASWPSGSASNTMAASRICSIVIEIPDNSHLYADRNIGVWSVSKLATDSGGWRQINRFGIPMMWPIFRPDDDAYASDMNTVVPSDDWSKDAAHIASLVAGVSGAGGTANSQAYGERIADRLLPDVLPYQIGTPAGFTFGGFNGRTLEDNAAEVMFSLVANSAISTGLGPQSADAARSDRFPYVVGV